MLEIPVGDEQAYVEDPNEEAPCLVCGEPKPNSKPCLTANCDLFGGAKRTFMLEVTVVAEKSDDLPSPDAVRDALADGVPDEWHSLVGGDPWMLDDIGLVNGGAFRDNDMEDAFGLNEEDA